MFIKIVYSSSKRTEMPLTDDVRGHIFFIRTRPVKDDNLEIKMMQQIQHRFKKENVDVEEKIKSNTSQLCFFPP